MSFPFALRLFVFSLFLSSSSRHSSDIYSTLVVAVTVAVALAAASDYPFKSVSNDIEHSLSENYLHFLFDDHSVSPFSLKKIILDLIL